MQVFSTTGEIGVAGKSYPCRMAGCNGKRITVKWANGKHTRPCTKGMLYNGDQDAWYIMDQHGKVHAHFSDPIVTQ